MLNRPESKRNITITFELNVMQSVVNFHATCLRLVSADKVTRAIFFETEGQMMEWHTSIMRVQGFADPEQQYKLINQLGRGALATVWLAEHANSKMKVALKVISRHKVDKMYGNFKSQYDESEVCKRISKIKSHYLLRLMDTFENTKAYYIVNEYMPHGDLKNYLRQNNKIMMNELRVRNIARQVARGLKDLHDNHIVHRDIKLANILVFKDEKGEEKVKIGDFGCSCELKPPRFIHNLSVGTVGYEAPELIQCQEYSFGIDVWSLGSFIWFLMSGTFPFYHADQAEQEWKVCNEPITFDQNEYTRLFSLPLMDLFVNMLERNPRQRYNIN